jgi:hypothetical protein
MLFGVVRVEEPLEFDDEKERRLRGVYGVKGVEGERWCHWGFELERECWW